MKQFYNINKYFETIQRKPKLRVIGPWKSEIELFVEYGMRQINLQKSTLEIVKDHGTVLCLYFCF